MITIGVLIRQRIIREAMCIMLNSNDEFSADEIHDEQVDWNKLLHEVKEKQPNILLFDIFAHNFDEMHFIQQMTTACPKTKVLVTWLQGNESNESTILKTIKAGAKGFLDINAGRNELFEAIYTLRGGYDYYSESITHMLLGKYLNKIKQKEAIETPGVEALSNRQIEIIKLWGQNLSNQEIADKLFISIRTVESHKNHIMTALDLKTSVDLVKFGIKNNLIDLE